MREDASCCCNLVYVCMIMHVIWRERERKRDNFVLYVLRVCVCVTQAD